MAQEDETQRAVHAMLSQILPMREIDPDTDIFETGLVNSLLALQIINRLEMTFGIQIRDEDLDRENFATITKMARFAARKQAGGCKRTL